MCSVKNRFGKFAPINPRNPMIFKKTDDGWLHAARYAERGGDGGEDADDDLYHRLPCFFLHDVFWDY